MYVNGVTTIRIVTGVTGVRRWGNNYTYCDWGNRLRRWGNNYTYCDWGNRCMSLG